MTSGIQMIRALALAALLVCATQAVAHDASPELDVSESAEAAAAAVDRFSAALSAGDFDEVRALLDPDVIILESGGAEHSAAEYLGGHAKADAEFLKGAQHILKRRVGRASDGLAWIASESEPASTETMVLRSGEDGWKIVHIHWSSRAVQPGEAH